jgi:hypothetical protein
VNDERHHQRVKTEHERFFFREISASVHAAERRANPGDQRIAGPLSAFTVPLLPGPPSETFNYRGDRFGTLQNPRTTASGVQSRRFDQEGFDGRNHIFAREAASWHRDWDLHLDHLWRGHRCRFVNGTWIIFDEGFYPYDLYPCDYPYDN